jgi:hypothetical protein
MKGKHTEYERKLHEQMLKSMHHAAAGRHARRISHSYALSIAINWRNVICRLRESDNAPPGFGRRHSQPDGLEKDLTPSPKADNEERSNGDLRSTTNRPTQKEPQPAAIVEDPPHAQVEVTVRVLANSILMFHCLRWQQHQIMWSQWRRQASSFTPYIPHSKWVMLSTPSISLPICYSILLRVNLYLTVKPMCNNQSGLRCQR